MDSRLRWPTAEHICHSDVATAIASLRAVLAAIDAKELSRSAAYRNRLQGAVVVLEALVQRDQGDTIEPPEPTG